MPPPAVHSGSTLGLAVKPAVSPSAKQPCNEGPKQKATIERIQALVSEIKELDEMIAPYLLKG